MACLIKVRVRLYRPRWGRRRRDHPSAAPSWGGIPAASGQPQPWRHRVVESRSS